MNLHLYQPICHSFLVEIIKKLETQNMFLSESFCLISELDEK